MVKKKREPNATVYSIDINSGNHRGKEEGGSGKREAHCFEKEKTRDGPIEKKPCSSALVLSAEGKEITGDKNKALRSSRNNRRPIGLFPKYIGTKILQSARRSEKKGEGGKNPVSPLRLSGRGVQDFEVAKIRLGILLEETKRGRSLAEILENDLGGKERRGASTIYKQSLKGKKREDSRIATLK